MLAVSEVARLPFPACSFGGELVAQLATNEVRGFAHLSPGVCKGAVRAAEATTRAAVPSTEVQTGQQLRIQYAPTTTLVG